MTSFATKQRSLKFGFPVAKILWTICCLKRLQLLEKLPGDTSICDTLTPSSWASFPLFFFPWVPCQASLHPFLSFFIPFHLDALSSLEGASICKCFTPKKLKFSFFYISSLFFIPFKSHSILIFPFISIYMNFVWHETSNILYVWEAILWRHQCPWLDRIKIKAVYLHNYLRLWICANTM